MPKNDGLREEVSSAQLTPWTARRFTGGAAEQARASGPWRGRLCSAQAAIAAFILTAHIQLPFRELD